MPSTLLQNDLTPGYEQTLFSRDEKLNRLRLIGSRDGRSGSITIHQDVDLYASILEKGQTVVLDDVANRRVFVQIVSGSVAVNGETLSAGDGAQLRGKSSIEIAAYDDAELLLFNMS